MAEPTGRLKGFRILDMTDVLFGPFGTQTLGDGGAEIIRVESLTDDIWRNSGQGQSPGFPRPVPGFSSMYKLPVSG